MCRASRAPQAPTQALLYLILSLTAEALAQRGGGGGVAAVAQQLRERVDRLHRVGALRAERLSLQRVAVVGCPFWLCVNSQFITVQACVGMWLTPSPAPRSPATRGRRRSPCRGA